MNKEKAFISLKDHKPDFKNHPKCRLINPAKSQLGKVSKAILDKINHIIRTQTQINQWLNTSEAISWFKEIKDKHRKSFISFDIVEFYRYYKARTQIPPVPQEPHMVKMQFKQHLRRNNGKL